MREYIDHYEFTSRLLIGTVAAIMMLWQVRLLKHFDMIMSDTRSLGTFGIIFLFMWIFQPAWVVWSEYATKWLVEQYRKKRGAQG